MLKLQIKLAPKLTYQLKLSPRMKFLLKILELPLIKLKEYIQLEIDRNPLLEEEAPTTKSLESLDLQKEEKFKEFQESLLESPVSLEEYLFTQLHLNAPETLDFKIGQEIIGQINDDGYFTGNIQEISRKLEVAKEKTEKILALIKTFDPAGTGSRDLRECLLLQLKLKGQLDSLAGRIVEGYLNSISRKNWPALARIFKVPLAKIKEAVKEISALEPKPGRPFSSEKVIFLLPDAAVEKSGRELKIELNDRELPPLKINARYLKIMHDPKTPENVKKFLAERLKAAQYLIKAVSKRHQTLQKIIEELVLCQKKFFQGSDKLQPLTITEIARKIGKHKSTASRAIANKCLETPRGTFELKYFLSPGVKQKDGTVISSKFIKSKIKKIIKSENQKKPLTDKELVKVLKEKSGISLARRTVAKYRKQLKILNSQTRY